MDTALKLVFATIFAVFLNAIIDKIFEYFVEYSTPELPTMLMAFFCNFGILEGINIFIRFLVIGWVIKNWIAFIRG